MKGIANLIACVVLCIMFSVLTLGAALVPLGLAIAYIRVGSEKRREAALSRLGTTLMTGETLIASAIQKRVFALIVRRVVVAITSSRIITIKRGIFGGFTMQDVQWKDLVDATMSENVLPSLCGSNIAFKHMARNVGRIAVDGIDSDVAASIYTKAQFEEQAWEEKRRVRAIEEVRAAAGGVTVHSPAIAEAPKPSEGNRLLGEISKAKELLDFGAISDAEFQEMKSKILAA